MKEDNNNNGKPAYDVDDTSDSWTWARKTLMQIYSNDSLVEIEEKIAELKARAAKG